MELTAINRYPVKSCRGQALRTATVERLGLAGDRRWMLIDSDNETATAREYPRLLLVVPELVDGGVVLRAPGLPDLAVAEPTSNHSIAVTVHGRGPWPAALAEDVAHAWFSEIAGVRLRLVHQPAPDSRHPNPDFSLPQDRVSLADGYPYLVTTEESLAAVNEWVAAGPLAAEGPLPMRRFRPNLVVRGDAAWAEDGWRRLRIGPATFRAVKGCDRCVLTTINPDTAAKGKEPIATLARHRRWDGKTWFGMNLIPDDPGTTLTVGDEVEILESVPAPDGPPR